MSEAYVAIVSYCAQVGMEQWQRFQCAKLLPTGLETVQEIMTWAKEVTNDPNVNVTIVKEGEQHWQGPWRELQTPISKEGKP